MKARCPLPVARPGPAGTARCRRSTVQPQAGEHLDCRARLQWHRRTGAIPPPSTLQRPCRSDDRLLQAGGPGAPGLRDPVVVGRRIECRLTDPRRSVCSRRRLIDHAERHHVTSRTDSDTGRSDGPGHVLVPPAPVDHAGRDVVSSTHRLSRQHHNVILVLMVAAFTVVLNETVMSVALPVLQVDLGVALSVAQWLTTAY